MRWDREGIDWPNRGASRFVRAGDVHWHVQQAGEGPVLLLLHGTGGSTHSWAALFPRLAEHYNVIAPDLPGHAFSQPAAGRALSLPGMARALGALLSKIGVQPDVIIGHSAGCPVAVQMHLDGHAEPRRIIGFNAALMPFQGLAGQIFPPLAKALVLNPFVPRLATMTASKSRIDSLLKSTGAMPPPESTARYRQLFNDHRHVGAALGMMARWDLDALQERWAEVRVPVDLIVGTKDGTVPPSDAPKVAAAMPGVTVHRMEGRGHLAHEEDPEAALALIDSILADSGVETKS